MCDKYLECDYCAYDNNCSIQLNGTAHECVKSFLCSAAECNDVSCIEEDKSAPGARI